MGATNVSSSVRETIYKQEVLLGGMGAPLRWIDQSVPLEDHMPLGERRRTWVRNNVWT
jgi:hypothetical protein